MVGKQASKLILEVYLDFSRNPNDCNLTKHQINQIMSMHGFTKLYNVSRKDMMDKLLTIEPMTLTRSTLKQKGASSAILALNEVKEDLLALDWAECCVQSVETFGIGKEKICVDEQIEIDCGSNNWNLKRKQSSMKVKMIRPTASGRSPPGFSCLSIGSSC